MKSVVYVIKQTIVSNAVSLISVGTLFSQAIASHLVLGSTKVSHTKNPSKLLTGMCRKTGSSANLRA